MSNSLVRVNALIDQAEQSIGKLDVLSKKALRSAINRALESGRVAISRAATGEYQLRQKDINKNLKVQKAGTGSLLGILTYSGKPLPLSSYKVSPRTVNGKRRSAIRVGVKRGTNEKLDFGFIARVNESNNKGHTGVFVRVTDRRLPIAELYGPSIPQVVDDESITSAYDERATQVLEERFAHEMDRAMKGGK